MIKKAGIPLFVICYTHLADPGWQASQVFAPSLAAWKPGKNLLLSFLDSSIGYSSDILFQNLYLLFLKYYFNF